MSKKDYIVDKGYSLEEVCFILKAIQKKSKDCQQVVLNVLDNIIKEEKIKHYDLLKEYKEASENTITPLQFIEEKITSLEKILTFLEDK